jgi:lipoate-protein ligase A
MSEPWYLWENGVMAPASNMAGDEALLESAGVIGHPVLRFYGWSEPATTFGYFQKYREIADLTTARPIVRRPTGGGLVPHASDWTYSVTIPPTHGWYRVNAVESYRRVHEWLRMGFEVLGVKTELSPCCVPEGPGQCFVGAEQYDLLWRGRKIAGAAQRRNRSGLLIQGSVQSQPPEVTREAWEKALARVASEQWQVDWRPFPLTPAFQSRVEELVTTKYANPDYNERR